MHYTKTLVWLDRRGKIKINDHMNTNSPISPDDSQEVFYKEILGPTLYEGFGPNLVCVCVYVYVCVCVCMYACMYVCICMYVCMDGWQ